MNADLAQELLNELGSSLERLEAQHHALLHFLKDKNVITDDQLAPYLSQAGDISSVRWRGVRVRLEHLFSGAKEKEEHLAEKLDRQSGVAEKPAQRQEEQTKDKSHRENDEKPTPKGDAEPGATTEIAAAKPDTEKKQNADKQSTEEKKPSPKQKENAA